MTAPIGFEVPGRALAFWPGNPLSLAVDWDIDDPAGGHSWRLDVIRGDTGRPSAIWPAVVVVDGQLITATWAAAATREWGPGSVWRLLRDDVTVIAGKMARGTPQVDDDTPLNPTLTVDLAGGLSSTITVPTGDSPAPSTEVDYAAKTANQVINLNTLIIAPISEMSVDIPDLSVPVYVHALVKAQHTVVNAYIGPCLADPAINPTLITQGIALEYGALSAIGTRQTVPLTARIAPNTPCTIQVYISGTGGNCTVISESYAKSIIWAETR